MAGGTPAPPRASPWVLLGEYPRGRAGKLAFPKNPILVKPQAQVLQSSPPPSPGSELLSVYYTESRASCSRKEFLNPHDPDKPWDDSLPPQ